MKIRIMMAMLIVSGVALAGTRLWEIKTTVTGTRSSVVVNRPMLVQSIRVLFDRHVTNSFTLSVCEKGTHITNDVFTSSSTHTNFYFFSGTIGFSQGDELIFNNTETNARVTVYYEAE